MNTKFKRHEKIILLVDPDPEYIEYYREDCPPIKKGSSGKINMLLPNGQYHVEIIDEKTSDTIAYVIMSEEYLKLQDK